MKRTSLLWGTMILGLGLTGAASAQPAPNHDRDARVYSQYRDRDDHRRGDGDHDRDDGYKWNAQRQRKDKDHDRDDRNTWRRDHDRNPWTGWATNNMRRRNDR